MNNVLIARFKSEKEAKEAAKVLGKKAEVLLGESLETMEDEALAKLIDEGMESDDVDTDEFLADLNRRVADSK